MKYLPCIRRQDIVYLDLDGTKVLKQRCTHQSSAHYGTDVSVAICEACPVRVIPELRHLVPNLPVTARDFEEPKIKPDGTIVYPRTGLEPPVVPGGYKRKSDDIRADDAWVFVPLWSPCVDRGMANKVRPCGCIEVYQFCMSNKVTPYGQRVEPDTCEACTVRRPPEGLD